MFHPAIVSIRTRLLFSFLVLLSVPVVTLGIIGPLIFSRSIETQTVDHTLRMIAQVDKNLEYHVSAVERLIALTERDPAIAAFFAGAMSDSEEKAALSFMDSCAQTHPEIAGMLLVAADDRMLSGFYDRIARDPLTLEPWYMKAVGKQRELTIIARPIGRNIRSRRGFGTDDVVSVVKPVAAAGSHRIVGAILVDLRLDRIEEVLADSSLGRDGFLYISDPEGELVYAPVNRIVYRLSPLALAGEEGRKTLTTAGGSYQVLYKESAYTGWKTVGVFSERATLREVDFVRLYSLVVGGVTIALAALLAVFFASSIARPLTDLRKLMKRAETGDFEARFEDDRGDEISQLGHSFNAMGEAIRNLIAQVYLEPQRKREAELRVLQEQIKPHFLYNTLDTIQWMAQEHGAQDIVCIVAALTKLFRVGLSRGREIILVSEEIQHAESYLCIQKARYEDKFDYAISVAQGLDSCRVLKLVLQPLVENAIYHGIKERRGSGKIQIEAYREADELVFVVRDDGMGMTEEKLERLRADLDRPIRAGQERLEERQGFGARNVHERIRLSFGGRYGLSYRSVRGEGTTVTVRQPIVEED
jgi:two-component system sensor histidine kinase YesM